MFQRQLIAAAIIVACSSAASALPVDQFIARADALKAKGVAALFSSDLKRLRNLTLADLMQIRSERRAAQAAGRPTAFCPPENGVRMTDKDVMDAMQAVPPGDRPRTDTKQALLAYLSKRFPCPRR